MYSKGGVQGPEDSAFLCLPGGLRLISQSLDALISSSI